MHHLARTVARTWPLLLLAAILLGAWASGAPGLLAPDSWRPRLAEARAIATAQPLLAIASYIALYTLVVAVSLPAGTALTLLGGAVFGAVLGGTLAIAAATLGATILFLIARTTLSVPLARRYAPLIARVRAQLERDGFFAVLILRLLPFVPFWLINLASGLAGLRTLPFVLGTALGIMPAVTVIASVGAGLGNVLANHQALTPWLLLRPSVLLPRVGLALLAASPLLLRRMRRG